MKRTILLIILAILFIAALMAVGLVWAQAGDIVIWPVPTTPVYDTVPVGSQYGTPSPRAYLPVVAGAGLPTPTRPAIPRPTSTPGPGP